MVPRRLKLEITPNPSRVKRLRSNDDSYLQPFIHSPMAIVVNSGSGDGITPKGYWTSYSITERDTLSTLIFFAITSHGLEVNFYSD